MVRNPSSFLIFKLLFSLESSSVVRNQRSYRATKKLWL